MKKIFLISIVSITLNFCASYTLLGCGCGCGGDHGEDKTEN